MELEVGISHLRDTLGIAVQHVACTEDPIIIRRYKRTDVVLVPQERGISEETARRYGIGLARRGIMAGYIVVPVWDVPKGEYPAGDIGRCAGEDFDDDQGRPRYKLPPNFPKQRYLFGVNEALDGTDGQPPIVVEGVFGALRPPPPPHPS